MTCKLYETMYEIFETRYILVQEKPLPNYLNRLSIIQLKLGLKVTENRSVSFIVFVLVHADPADLN